MSQTYTALFLRRQGLEGTAESTPPTGFLWVVRDVSVYQGAQIIEPGGSIALLEGGETCRFFAWSTPLEEIGSKRSFHWEGRQVVLPGGIIVADQEAGNCDILVSGFQFSA